MKRWESTESFWPKCRWSSRKQILIRWNSLSFLFLYWTWTQFILLLTCFMFIRFIVLLRPSDFLFKIISMAERSFMSLCPLLPTYNSDICKTTEFVFISLSLCCWNIKEHQIYLHNRNFMISSQSVRRQECSGIWEV